MTEISGNLKSFSLCLFVINVYIFVLDKKQDLDVVILYKKLDFICNSGYFWPVGRTINKAYGKNSGTLVQSFRSVASPQTSCGVCFCSSRIHFSPKLASFRKSLNPGIYEVDLFDRANANAFSLQRRQKQSTVL